MSGISLRAIILGLAAVVAVCFIVAYAELVTMHIQIGFLQLPPVVVALLFFMVVLSRYAGKARERLRLNAQEMMTIYSMMLVAAMITSRGLMEKLIALLVAPNYYANDANRWQKLFFPYIKKWMVPWDPEGEPQQWLTLRFYEGLRQGETIPGSRGFCRWRRGRSWCWRSSLASSAWQRCCVAGWKRAALLPAGAAPLEMARSGDTFLRNRLTWFGFAIPTILFSLNGLHQIVPTVPSVNLNLSLNQWFPNPPYSAMYYTPIYISFAAIGSSTSCPPICSSRCGSSSPSRGCKMCLPPCSTRRWRQCRSTPPASTSATRCWALTGAGRLLPLRGAAAPRQVWRAAMGRGKADDSRELLPYGVAFWGLTASVLVSAAWFMMAGVCWWFALVEILVYFFVVALVMARSVAECGMLMTETSFRPIDMHSVFAARHTLGGSNLTALGFIDAAFLRDQRGLILTGFLDGLRLGDGVGLRRRAFLPVFAGAIALALLVAGFLHLWIPYHRGGINLYYYVYSGNPLWAFQNHAPAVENPVNFDWRAPVFTMVGVAVALVLVVMRATFFWWPLHPMGYALSASWTLIVFWFPCFVAWVIKAVISRYGGMKYYLIARPFFLGMILAEFSMAVLWTLLSATFGISPPAFPWP